MQTRHIDGPRGPVVFTDQGRGPALLLIAGLGSDSRLWGEFPAILSKNFRVITVENRGIGAARQGKTFSFSGAAADILLCLDTLDISRTSLLGVSMGGIIAQRCALDFPDRLQRLVIASAAARLSEHGRRTMSMLRTLLEYLPPAEFGKALMNLAFAPPFQNRHPAFVRQAAELYGLAPADLQGARSQADELLRSWDYREELEQLKIPALILAGERDAVVSIEDTREIADAIPGAEFLGIADAGHSVLAEGGPEVLERIIAFLLSTS